MVHLLSALLLALYGLNTLILVALYLRHRHTSVTAPPLTSTPTVTVQLPIYNERYVVERLIEAATQLDYPRQRLHIQVLDDSHDETSLLARRTVEHQRARGIDIEYLHRAERIEFKAGALREGFKTARGELIAVFDADFVPPPDFLRRTVPYFLTRPRLGLVQARWAHLNAEWSPLTRAQAIALDGHFVVEQTARQRAGLWMNFNGSAGLWRRACIEQAGGWQGDTLSEDMDLSYRAQLAGWECLYLPEVAAPAEIPAQMQAFKRQQARWAQGSIQCALKLGPAILRSPRSLFSRTQGLLHLTSYLIHPLLLLWLITALPMSLWELDRFWPTAYLSLGTLGPPLLFALAQKELYPDWRQRLGAFPVLVLLGMGITLSNSLAIVRALLRRPSEFRRTPKFGAERWPRRYSLPWEWSALGELGLAAYAAMAAAVSAGRSAPLAIFLLLYSLGLGMVGLWTILHGLPLPLPIRWTDRWRRWAAQFSSYVR